MSPRARFLLLSLLLGCDARDARVALDDVLDASEPGGERVDASRPARDAQLAMVDARRDEASVRDAAVDAFVELPYGPQLPDNPYAAGDGFATQHGDPGASDTTPLPGPGAKVKSTPLDLLAVCPSLLPREDGTLLAICTQIANQTPAVFLIDAAQLRTLASLQLTKGDLFGGVYPFLDREGRVVVVDGANELLRIGVEAGALKIVEQVALGDAVSAHCGSRTCDSVVGLAPDYAGQVWYATASGLVGIAGGGTLDLKEGVANSIAIAPEGTAVVTDHALYLLTAVGGAPRVTMRAEYDRGSARKPGQLSWGSGSTPTFFGPRTGSEYLAITDNARPTFKLVVHRTDGSPEPVCTLAVPSPAGDASENSPIGAGRSVIVTSTFGYPYLALPKNARVSVPDSAPLTGGMARIDVLADESCKLVWTNAVRSATVPKLSTADRSIYTIERKLTLGPNSSPFDGYAYTVIDPQTGAVTTSQTLSLSDPMQLAGTIGRARAWYQGTTTGLARIEPSP
ncbi:MAG TPA: hypothetical protein VFX59_14340 [Polyangiales bacterium]|nr:hypothetical protein [Polyangiales bacterium]